MHIFEDFENIKYGLSYAKSLKKRFSTFTLPNSYLYNHVFSYKLLWNLYHDFSQWKAFTLGLIDEKGNEIRKPSSKEEHEAWNYYYKIIAKLKKQLKNVVNDKKLDTIYNRLFLVREEHELKEIEKELTEYLVEHDCEHCIIESVSAGDIAGFGNGFNYKKGDNRKMKFRDFIEQVKTSKDNGHYHAVNVDVKGNGKTIKTFGSSEHVHNINNFDVETVNNHSHILI